MMNAVQITGENFLKYLGIGKRWNAYLDIGPARVYMRVDQYPIGQGNITHAIIIANISMPEEAQHKGHFTNLCLKLHLVEPTLPIVVECVHNEGFRQALLRRGFVPRTGHLDQTTVVYMPPTPEANNDNGKIDLSDLVFGRLLDHMPDDSMWRMGNLYKEGLHTVNYYCQLWADNKSSYYKTATSPEQALRLALVALDPTKFQTN